MILEIIDVRSFGHSFLLNKYTMQHKACTLLIKKGLIGILHTKFSYFMIIWSEMQNTGQTYEWIASCKSERKKKES